MKLVLRPLCLLLTSSAIAAPVREAGREQFSTQVDQGRVETGFVDFGAYFRNPNGAASARADGTGSALFKYQTYVADALDGDVFQFVGDGVFLTDRDTSNSLKPVSVDYLLGLASRLDHLRVQFDRQELLPLRGNGGWRNWDVRGSVLFGSEETGQNGTGWPPGGNGRRRSSLVSSWSGALTTGYLFNAGGTPSRMDGSGAAKWHYIAALQSECLNRRLLVRVDADMLTDSFSRRGLPSDLDLDLGAGTSYQNVEFMVHRRSRESIGAPGYATYYLLTVRTRFDSRAAFPAQ